MNLDKMKIAKGLVIIILIIILVASITYIWKDSSKTLSDIAGENSNLTLQDVAANNESNSETGVDSDETDLSNETAVNGTDSNNGTEPYEANTDNGTVTNDTDLSNGTNTDGSGNNQNIGESQATSSLIGALLNGSQMIDERIVHASGFYYEPLSNYLRRYITGVSYPAYDEDLEITYDDLRYVHLLHYDFSGEPIEGEIICNEKIAQDLVEIFYELYKNEYQIEKILLIDEYDGDDLASMEDNNTSCFNYRLVEGSSNLSKHALGLAIDINPFYNPYVTYNSDGSIRVSPTQSEPYADRNRNFPYKIDDNDLCYKLFIERGFIWGGNWNSVKDYQHFQKTFD